jgi:hypothetical protein
VEIKAAQKFSWLLEPGESVFHGPFLLCLQAPSPNVCRQLLTPIAKFRTHGNAAFKKTIESRYQYLSRYGH